MNATASVRFAVSMIHALFAGSVKKCDTRAIYREPDTTQSDVPTRVRGGDHAMLHFALCVALWGDAVGECATDAARCREETASVEFAPVVRALRFP